MGDGDLQAVVDALAEGATITVDATGEHARNFEQTVTAVDVATWRVPYGDDWVLGQFRADGKKGGTHRYWCDATADRPLTTRRTDDSGRRTVLRVAVADGPSWSYDGDVSMDYGDWTPEYDRETIVARMDGADSVAALADDLGIRTEQLLRTLGYHDLDDRVARSKHDRVEQDDRTPRFSG